MIVSFPLEKSTLWFPTISPFLIELKLIFLLKGKVFFSSGKETITLDHEAFDRALYSEGAFTAAKWLMSKKPGLYSMRDVLNFK